MFLTWHPHKCINIEDKWIHRFIFIPEIASFLHEFYFDVCDSWRDMRIFMIWKLMTLHSKLNWLLSKWIRTFVGTHKISFQLLTWVRTENQIANENNERCQLPLASWHNHLQWQQRLHILHTTHCTLDQNDNICTMYTTYYNPEPSSKWNQINPNEALHWTSTHSHMSWLHKACSFTLCAPFRNEKCHEFFNWICWADESKITWNIIEIQWQYSSLFLIRSFSFGC